MDVDANSFTSQELKKALAKMKASEKAERKVSGESCLFPPAVLRAQVQPLQPYTPHKCDG